MKLNLIFEDTKIYNVQTEIDVVKDVSFKLEVLEGTETTDLYTNNDQIVDIDGDNVEAKNVGTAILRFMDQTTVIKDLKVNVVTTTGGEQTNDLHGKLGTPVPKKESKK